MASSERFRSTIEHLRTLEYAPHDFVIDLLTDTDWRYARLRAEFHTNGERVLRRLLRGPPGSGGKYAAITLCLRVLAFSMSDLVAGLLKHDDDFVTVRDVPAILDVISPIAPSEVSSWAIAHSGGLYRREMLAITQKSAGFHANASKLQPEHVEELDLPGLAAKLRQHAPLLWQLFSTLVDAKWSNRRIARTEGRRELVLDGGGDLGGEDNLIPVSHTDADAQGASASTGMDIDLDQSAGGARQVHHSRGAVGRNDALTELKVMTMLGVAQQSTNQQCNAVQTHMGLFLRLSNTPDLVIHVLNHIGISVSSDSIESSCNSLHNAWLRRLTLEGPTLTAQLGYDNFNFLDHVAIPVPGHEHVFVNAISAVIIRSHPCLTKGHFKCADLLWWYNPANEVPRFPPYPSPKIPSYADILQLAALLDPRATSDPDFDPVDDQLATLAWHIRRILVERETDFSWLADLLGEPPEVLRIPLHKTEYLPIRAMDLNQSKTGENSKALDTLLREMNFPPDAADEYVTFVHGDLGGSERIHASQADRCDEDDPLSQFKNIVDCPGLFHIRMATSDALYRIYVAPSAARHKEPGVWKYITFLRSSSELHKFTAKGGPGFRRMSDASTHLTWALILECWVLEAQKWDASCTSLAAFASRLRACVSKAAAWDVVMQLSRKIASVYVAGNEFSRTRRKPGAERDQVFENTSLFLSHSLSDQILAYAVKSQDVGRVLLTLYDWQYIYHAVRKHKYALHATRVLYNLVHVFPKPLAHAFMMSWIINPSGKPMGGRGADWLLELFNLYLKTVHCGSSSNYGLERMIKNSTLITLFKTVFDNFVLHYHIMTHNVRHAPADVSEVITRVRREITLDKVLQFDAGRKSRYEYQDALTEGQAGYMSDAFGKLSAKEAADTIFAVELDDFFD